jgi:hypothetical protein
MRVPRGYAAGRCHYNFSRELNLNRRMAATSEQESDPLPLVLHRRERAKSWLFERILYQGGPVGQFC